LGVAGAIAGVSSAKIRADPIASEIATASAAFRARESLFEERSVRECRAGRIDDEFNVENTMFLLTKW